MRRHYSLDSLVVRGRRVFGWGFCLDLDRPLRVRALRLPLEGGSTFDLSVHASGQREDLREAFPQSPHAAGAGFMVTGRLPAGVARGTAQLVLHGSGECLLLPGFPEAYLPGTDLPMSRGWARLRVIARQRGWRKALAAAWQGLRRRRLLVAQPRWERSAEAAREAWVIIDHDMGGGANRYREGRIELLRSQGHCVVLVTSDLSSLSYRLRILPAGSAGEIERRVEEQPVLLELLRGIEPRAIEVNNLVGYEDPPAMLARWVEMRREMPGLAFRFNLHDFHALCPAFTLIDASGKHCGVPDTMVCRACLPANARFSLGMNEGLDVTDWRAAWAAWLALVDERVAFSRSSLELLGRAMPEIAAMPWRLEPHAADHAGLRAIKPRLAEPLVVAAVGHLNHAKGAGLVGSLARRAEERRLPLRFVVVGTVEGGAVPPSVRVTGAFKKEALCDHLEAEQVAVALVPSICPETYSYVTDELMATGLPLAVLDLGAPAERVAGYHAGLLLPLAGLDEQLDALVAFGRRLGALS